MTAVDPMSELVSNHPRARQRFFEYYRGGLPSQSVPGGSRGSETPLPAFDRVDRQLSEAWKNYQSWLTIALATNSQGRRATAIHNATRIQQWFLLSPDPIEDVPCDNSHCTNLLPLGRKSGKCGACRIREFRKRQRQAMLDNPGMSGVT